MVYWENLGNAIFLDWKELIRVYIVIPKLFLSMWLLKAGKKKYSETMAELLSWVPPKSKKRRPLSPWEHSSFKAMLSISSFRPLPNNAADLSA